MKKLFASLLMISSSLVCAQELHTFSNGELADAEKINENFEQLKRTIDDIDLQPISLPRDEVCKQEDLEGQWYQTKGITGGFEISVSNFYSSGDYIIEGLQVTAAGQEEFVVYGNYEFDSNICGFTLSIVNLPARGIGVMNLDKSVMKLTVADGAGEYGDFTLILVAEQPDNSLLSKQARSENIETKTFSPSDFVPSDISFASAVELSSKN
jgi:hypothetical protein